MKNNAQPILAPIDITTRDEQSYIVDGKFLYRVIQKLSTPQSIEELKQQLIHTVRQSDGFAILDKNIEDLMYFPRVLQHESIYQLVEEQLLAERTAERTQAI